MRHTLRMAAMMEIPGVFVFSHNSIGIGKNGPTHQPVETLLSLRAYRSCCYPILAYLYRWQPR